MSRRCWQLVCSLQLLHTMEVCISGESDEEAMPRLRSLAHFLLLHGAGSVRQLRLDLGGCGEEDDTQIECMGLVAAATAACSGLEELGLCSRFTVTLSSWLLPHRSSLRQLWTGEETCTVVAAPLGLMTALQELGMGQLSQYVYFEEGARLPTSLTRLVLGNGGYDDAIPMPPQVRGRLHCLLKRCRADAVMHGCLPCPPGDAMPSCSEMAKSYHAMSRLVVCVLALLTAPPASLRCRSARCAICSALASGTLSKTPAAMRRSRGWRSCTHSSWRAASTCFQTACPR